MFVVGLVGRSHLQDPPKSKILGRGIYPRSYRIVLRLKFFSSCLLFNCWTLAICLGTGQPKKKKVVNKINKIIKIASSHIS